MTDWITVGEQAEKWRCSPDAIYSAIDAKRLPATKIAGRWLLAPEDVTAFERANRSITVTAKRTRAPRKRVARS